MESAKLTNHVLCGFPRRTFQIFLGYYQMVINHFVSTTLRKNCKTTNINNQAYDNMIGTKSTIKTL